MRVENVKGAVWTVDEVEFHKRRPQRSTSGYEHNNNKLVSLSLSLSLCKSFTSLLFFIETLFFQFFDTDGPPFEFLSYFAGSLFHQIHSLHKIIFFTSHFNHFECLHFFVLFFLKQLRYILPFSWLSHSSFIL